MLKRFSMCLIILSSFFLINAYAAKPINLTIAKARVVTYYESGTYQKRVNALVAHAKKILEKRIAQTKGHQKLAIILDIDDTSINNYPIEKEHDFASTLPMIEETFRRSHEANPAILSLYNYAKAHGVAVFFITGRPQPFYDITVENLKLAGYKNWNKLYTHSNISREASIKQNASTNYKQAVRQSLRKQGYEIVLNIGDQATDLTNSHADLNVKLPNYMYQV